MRVKELLKAMTALSEADPEVYLSIGPDPEVYLCIGHYVCYEGKVSDIIYDGDVIRISANSVYMTPSTFRKVVDDINNGKVE